MPVTGLDDPIAVTPPRPSPSIRRTSHVDMTPAPDGSLLLAGVARDLRTTESGAEEVGRANVDVALDPRRVVLGLETSGDPQRTAPLVGLVAMRGFRAAVDAAVPEERERATPLYLLLDEIPVASFISGYSYLYSGAFDGSSAGAGVGVREDICAGWRSDGTMMVAIRRDDRIPIPYGPRANDLVPDDDPQAWHDLPPLAPGSMRRQRLVQVAAGGPMPVYAMFRDSHADDDGRVTILHEYAVTSSLDPRSLVLSGTRAEAHVLPWPECPEAAASASRLDGHAAHLVRDVVRADFSGVSTCTHLNDLLRSLADVAALAGALHE